MPLIPTALRITSRGGKISDNFNRSITGDLGVTSTGGVDWEILTGVWNVNGTRPTTATSHTSNPLAVVTLGTANVDTRLTVGAGDALYFRVQDASNWWRVLWEGWQTSSCQTCCSTCCSTCCDTCQYRYKVCTLEGNPCGQCNTGGCSCSCYPQSCANAGSCYQSCNCYSCNCNSCNCNSCNCVYYDNYRARLQKMVGGTLTDVATGSTLQGAGNATVEVRAVTQGDSLTTYHGATLLHSGTQVDHASQKKHGIGRGASNYNTSAIDNFEMAF